jgi:pantoate--beta-alanine ligase
VISDIASAVAGGGRVVAAEATAVRRLEETGFGPIDYVEVRRADDLSRLGPGPTDGPARVLAAAWLGRTRLIDNVSV